MLSARECTSKMLQRQNRAYEQKSSRITEITLIIRSILVVKKLRYYARFIVVCILLDYMPTVKELIEELRESINEYEK